MPSEWQAWVVLDPKGKPMRDTVSSTKDRAMETAIMLSDEISKGATHREVESMGYRAAPVRCLVEDE